MKKTLTVMPLFFIMSGVGNASDLLTGDKKLACEAILCLASPGKRPQECQKSMRRYFGINERWWSDTVRARHNFLKKCPKK